MVSSFFANAVYFCMLALLLRLCLRCLGGLLCFDVYCLVAGFDVTLWLCTCSWMLCDAVLCGMILFFALCWLLDLVCFVSCAGTVCGWFIGCLGW